MTEGLRQASARELWERIEAYPGLASRAKISEARLLEEYPCVCLVNGDVSYEISVGADGIFLLTSLNRDLRRPAFRSNDARAFAVQLASLLPEGLVDFNPGRSPYDEAPRGFELAERRETDDCGREWLIVRWSWAEGSWAEVLSGHSLLYGLRWAWMFTSSDQTIANSVAQRDGWPLFRPREESEFAKPPGLTHSLTIEEWHRWREARR